MSDTRDDEKDESGAILIMIGVLMVIVGAGLMTILGINSTQWGRWMTYTGIGCITIGLILMT